MNIEKLAKHLKEFSLDEIEMIAEENCKTDLEHLLNEGKIVFENGVYKYVEKSENTCNYGIFIQNTALIQNVDFNAAVNLFLRNYVQKVCKKETLHQYKTIFKMHILPSFYDKNIQKICETDIRNFYIACKNRNLQPRRIKNILALLKQLLKYLKTEGFITNYVDFQVKRITKKNEFSMNRIIFEGD